jgi:hypothetical protein
LNGRTPARATHALRIGQAAKYYVAATQFLNVRFSAVCSPARRRVGYRGRFGTIAGLSFSPTVIVESADRDPPELLVGQDGSE